MKLAFIINDLSGGGAEKALKLLSDFLVGEGIDTMVITLQSGNDRYNLADGINRITLRSSRFGRGIGKVLGLPVQAAQLARIMHHWQPDVCVSFLPRSNVAHVMTRWFGNRRPILLTEQASSRDTYPTNAPRDRTMREMIRRFYPRANAVFPSSEGVLEGLVGFGIPRDRMRVVYNAVSLRDIETSMREPPPRDVAFGVVPTVITVGRHADQKDHETLLRAFALVRQRVEARLIFVGQGPLLSHLETLARDLCIADAVVFAGWQSNPFTVMGHADLFVLSSKFEGFGNVLVEAMACGLPVISTDCPSGPREILSDGDAGILVPVGDIDTLADAMVSVLVDSVLREQLIRKARLRAPDFDISAVGPRYLALLRSFVSNPPQSASERE